MDRVGVYVQDCERINDRRRMRQAVGALRSAKVRSGRKEGSRFMGRRMGREISLGWQSFLFLSFTFFMLPIEVFIGLGIAEAEVVP